jgi:hypothetical protein
MRKSYTFQYTMKEITTNTGEYNKKLEEIRKKQKNLD